MLGSPKMSASALQASNTTPHIILFQSFPLTVSSFQNMAFQHDTLRLQRAQARETLYFRGRTGRSAMSARLLVFHCSFLTLDASKAVISSTAGIVGLTERQQGISSRALVSFSSSQSTYRQGRGGGYYFIPHSLL